MATPTATYDLAHDHDAARFGLQPWERDHLLDKCFANRSYGGVQGRPQVILPHIQDGWTRGSLDWWVNGPSSGSSTVLVQRDGSLLRCIPERHAPWTNGDVREPTAQSRYLRSLGGNPNLWSLTIELEGRPQDAIPEAAMQTVVWQVRDWCERHDIPISADRIIPHGSVNSVSRSQCGLYVPKVMAELDLTAPGIPNRPSDFGTITTFPKPVRVTTTASDGVNIRRWGELDAEIMGNWDQGSQWFASGYVVGEGVSGEARWYILEGLTEYRVWSGATDMAGL